MVKILVMALGLAIAGCAGNAPEQSQRDSSNRGDRPGSGAFIQGDPDTSAILRAMEAELRRSLDSLHLQAGVKPYFLSYLYWDVELYRMEATLGTLEQSGFDRMQFLSVDLRLGSYDLDNSGFQGSIVFGPRLRAPLPHSNDTTLLRQAIWAATDAEYKVAIEKLAQKKAYLQNHRDETALPDFSRQKVGRFDVMEKRLPPDTGAITQLGKSVSATLQSFPELQESRAGYNYFYSTLYYVDSEGSRYRVGFQEHTFLVSLLAQAVDGAPLWDYFRCSRRDTPWCGEKDASTLAQKTSTEIQVLSERLRRLSGTPAEKDYRGPVLLSHSAAGDLVYKALLAPQAQLREPLGSQSQRHFLLGLEGRKYFPAFISIHDDPSRFHWKDRTLYGHYAFDHQAQPALPIQLIENGKISDFYRGKIPLQPNRPHSGNGHWRYGGGFPGVVEVYSEAAFDEEELHRHLCRLSDEEGINHGLVVSKVADEDALALLRHPLTHRLEISEAGGGRTFTLNTPVQMDRLECRTGKMQPVRGLTVPPLDSKSLRDIVATGRSHALYEPQASFSALVPGLLFSLMDMKGNLQPQPRLPYLAPEGISKKIAP